MSALEIVCSNEDGNAAICRITLREHPQLHSTVVYPNDFALVVKGHNELLRGYGRILGFECLQEG
jgi:hypothetical protein